jgi:hypothetical protein
LTILAPIVLFVYNRPEHTRKTIKALSNNLLANESELFIYSDAAKDTAGLDQVNEVRALIKTVTGFKSVTIFERKKNWGLATSIIDGVTTIVNKYERVIVLEDDLITSPYFLTYMNDALTLYENNEWVISIHGYVYPIKKKLPDYFFLKGADCWGWATWKRGWNLFNPDGEYLLNEIERQKLEKEFNFNNSFNYTGMLHDQIDGKISSWAIRWYASAFLANKYTLYPGKSFVENIGLDRTGTHCGEAKIRKMDLISEYTPITPIKVENSNKAKKLFADYFNSLSGRNSIRNNIVKVFKYFLSSEWDHWLH